VVEQPNRPGAQSGPGAQIGPEELDAILRLAESTARDAGALLLEQFGHIDRTKVRTKSAARDLVTSADVAAERLIVARLRKELPDHAIEAEEEIKDKADARLRWFLDPLDGTVNFVHGIPAFSVSLALYREKLPLVAVVHLPRLGETFVARSGGGAFLVGPDGARSRLHVSDAETLGESVLATGFPYRRNEFPNNNVANFQNLILKVRDIRRMGSAAMDLAYVAAGRFDGYWELHLSPHDLAAGALLVREAGGVVTDLNGGDDWLRAGHLVAAGPRLAGEIRSRVRA
jgi:myo-inositol-1(or 4)-monophosphatase